MVWRVLGELILPIVSLLLPTYSTFLGIRTLNLLITAQADKCLRTAGCTRAESLINILMFTRGYTSMISQVSLVSPMPVPPVIIWSCLDSGTSVLVLPCLHVHCLSWRDPLQMVASVVLDVTGGCVMCMEGATCYYCCWCGASTSKGEEYIKVVLLVKSW